MGRYNDPIEVTLVHDPVGGMRPARFTWRRSKKTVREVQDSWEEAGEWWSQAPAQTIWRVFTTDGGLFELACLHTTPRTWKVLYVWD